MNAGRSDSDDLLDRLVRIALEEDVGCGDVTSEWTLDPGATGHGFIVAKEGVVVAGIEAATRVFEAVDPGLTFEVEAEDGSLVMPGEGIVRIEGSLRSILTAERTALNFLGHLSGIAGLTFAFVEAVRGTGARIVDTRKTTPGMRALEKAAVRAGGATNHRMGLFDMVLIKDNHIAAAGGIGAAIDSVRRRNEGGLGVEVEVRTLTELAEALSRRPDRILLDNMDLATLRAAVDRVRAEPSDDPPELEASGNVTLDTVRAIAETGVDLISVGAITHSASAADLTLRVPALER
ncbi:MAG: carboxylating nicotinate-nucleotide diphosphorylase [Longimicrobiales bacterium]|nr:carboxylating nicotinate-nucleotide diphosphorylase [Longimicrobiales bacterium]